MSQTLPDSFLGGSLIGQSIGGDHLGELNSEPWKGRLAPGILAASLRRSDAAPIRPPGTLRLTFYIRLLRSYGIEHGGTRHARHAKLL